MSERASSSVSRARLFARTGPAAAGLALLLAGCTPGGAPAAETSAASPSPGAATATASPEPEAAGACLIGDWQITQEQLAGFYGAVSAETGGNAVFVPSGGTGLSFREDGTYTYSPAVHLDATIGGIEAVLDLGGTLDGTWTATDTTLSTDHTANALTVAGTVGGSPVDPAAFSEMIAQSPIAESTYDCSGEAPVISFGTATSATAITLVPAG